MSLGKDIYFEYTKAARIQMPVCKRIYVLCLSNFIRPKRSFILVNQSYLLKMQSNHHRMLFFFMQW